MTTQELARRTANAMAVRQTTDLAVRPKPQPKPRRAVVGGPKPVRVVTVFGAGMSLGAALGVAAYYGVLPF